MMLADEAQLLAACTKDLVDAGAHMMDASA